MTYDVITGRRRARSKEFRQHVSTALCQINQRLSGPGALDDSSLAGVVMMCLLSSGTAQPATTRIHLAGLCRMIELRGGIDALRASNLLLAEKAFR